MKDVKIDKAVKRDIPVILSCIKGLAEYVNQSEMVSATEDKLEKTIFGSDNFIEVYIAWKDDLPAGFVLFYKTYSTFKAVQGLYIEDLFVFPEYRSQGIGRKLLEHVICHAKNNGCHKVEWYVNNKNTKAIDFYNKFGASILDYKSIYYLTLE